MEYTAEYLSPLGPVTLRGDGGALTGLWFVGQKHYGAGARGSVESGEAPVFREVRHWLDVYFSGREPRFMPPVRLEGTPFQLRVWTALREVPYGGTVTYGDLARALGVPTSARAVGGAVGRNPVSILIPCHRVVGSDGRLTGYAGGIERKTALLRLEGHPL